ncbi:MAG: DUF4150 domain-containing protein [Myxococcales bacterium]|nr:DUF4150 domain-containing protein [Myxococcales bacterium]
MNLGFPDVCNTIVGPATAPIPYPNIAMNAQASGFSPTVSVSGMNALNQATQIPMTSGDEAGTAHPTIKGGSSYTLGNPIVFIDGMPAINLACPTTGNNMNNAAGAVLVPSITTVTYCDASRAAPALGEDAALSAHGLVLVWPPEGERGEPTVAHVRRGSRGFRAGVVAGDRLLAVDGRAATTLWPDELLRCLDGARDRALGLTVARGASGVARELACVPGSSDRRAVAVELLGDAVGCVALRAVSAEAPALVHAALEELRARGARALVLDLRGNPGGELDALLGIAGELLPPGTAVLRLRDADGDEVVRRARGRGSCDLPLAVLVDRGTASAAELLAGSLQAARRALLVGETTHGKGLAFATEVERRTWVATHAARAELRLPDGRTVHGVGVRPDLEVPMCEAECGVVAPGGGALWPDVALQCAHRAALGARVGGTRGR